MPVAEKTTGGEVYLRGIDQRVSIGDRVDVSEEFAEYLVEERTDFRLVDVQDVEFEETNNEDSPEDVDEASGFDPGSFLDRNVDPVVEDIKAGDVDGHLDEVNEAAERVTVQDAIGERRATLETQED
ncbi:hypothetical protein [Halobacterium sp. KA-6]|uniref:hypothetical protein n=1 Tax=Halobacterium sp. KA-6 TaxID=2896368 RepID=UPI001E2850AB|nr:hypothetical protein [Halobacterium sp. KA-6]MCD2204414.1 hypothetical protein [Halobacterium sp. KA-6]